MDKYQTIGSRFGALIIDWIILIPISIILQIVVAMFSNDLLLNYTTQVLTTLLTAIYFIYLHARNGQTFGKMICKVRVVNLEEEDITLQQSIIRSLPQIIQLMLIVLVQASVSSPKNPLNQFLIQYGVAIYGIVNTIWSLADIIVALSSEKHRALHDYIAGTVVIKTN